MNTSLNHHPDHDATLSAMPAFADRLEFRLPTRPALGAALMMNRMNGPGQTGIYTDRELLSENDRTPLAKWAALCGALALDGLLLGDRPCRSACRSRSHLCPTTPPASPGRRSPAATPTCSCATASAPCSTMPALLISIPAGVSRRTRPGAWPWSRSCSSARA